MTRAILLVLTIAAAFLAAQHYESQLPHNALWIGSLILVVLSVGAVAEGGPPSRTTMLLCMMGCAVAGGVALAMYIP